MPLGGTSEMQLPGFKPNDLGELTGPLQAAGYDGAELSAQPEGMPPELTAFEGLARVQFDAGWTSGSTTWKKDGETHPDGDED